MTLRLAQIGNFEPPHSTENDLYRTLTESMGCEVTQIQEQCIASWDALPYWLDDEMQKPDAVIWTRTASLSAQIPLKLRWQMLYIARACEVPTIGIHLDRWWGLRRQDDLYDDPFFRVEYLFTADGHDPKRWEALGANHHWMPPAIAPHNVYKGTPRPEFESDIAFVGGWQNYGHTEWAHRPQLVEFLRTNYEGRVRFWPEPGQHAVRGEALNDLYASVKVVVGDSCLVPDGAQPWTHYCSDRVFETIGRGALLVHPFVPGVLGGMGRTNPVGLLTHLTDYIGWEMGQWDDLRHQIDGALEAETKSQAVALQGYAHVRAHHTYKNRLLDIFQTVGLL